MKGDFRARLVRQAEEADIPSIDDLADAWAEREYERIEDEANGSYGSFTRAAVERALFLKALEAIDNHDKETANDR